MNSLNDFKKYTDSLLTQSKRMPVLFTSHGNPFDITVPREKRKFWNSLFNLGVQLQNQYEVKAAIIISAHWCTEGSFVNIADEQKQIYDYYGFPKEYYDVIYHAKGAADIAHEVKKIVPSVIETTDWGLDHGSWPMLMHLFPEANIPVFQLSIDYHAKPEYHFEIGKQLKNLRDKGVLIIGSGSLIHNLKLAMQKMRLNDMTPYGWEADYDLWLKKQLDERNIENLIHYQSSHTLGKMASPTPDHFVPVLYSLGLMNADDELKYFFEETPALPAFSERSFVIGNLI